MTKKFFTHIFAFIIIFTLGTTLVGAQPRPTSPTSQTPNNPTSQTPNTNVRGEIPNPFNCGGVANCDLFTFINSIVDRVLLPIGGVVAVIAFIWTGFMFVTAQGDEGKIKEARNALWYTAIGTAILLGAKVLTTVVKNTVGSLTN